ncbi:type IV pilus twitching motility protein PilT [Chloroflexota bacterium]
MDVNGLIELAIERSASDLHLNIGSEPILRIDGRLQKVDNLPSLTQGETLEALEQVTTKTQRGRFFEEKELDFSYQIPGLGRHRVNALVQQGEISIAFRLLSAVLSPLESLGLPPIYGELSLKPRGLILVTGPTGSGKSTSLAAMIKHINEREERHIITIEDPIEYVHENIKSLILQRNVGEDTVSFSEALRRALRHDPDVIVVGEMRDLTTMATAISAAETGHLVLGTLHTLDAPETINRIVDVFPDGQQSQIVLQLSQVLVAVLSQTLVPLIKGGRVPACEIMITNAAIKNTIRQKQIHMLHGIMELGRKDGLQTLNHALSRLVEDGLVSQDEALAKSSDTEELENTLKNRNQLVHAR